MEKQNHLIGLSPYFPPERAPSGWQSRRLALVPMAAAGPTRMSHGRSGFLQSAPNRELSAGNVPTQDFPPSTLDRDLRALQVGLQGVTDSIRQLEKTAGTVSEHFTVGINRLVDIQQPDTETSKRVEKILEALKANSEHVHCLELESLVRERELDKERLERMETELHAANLQVQLLAEELSQAQLKMAAQFGQMDEVKEAVDPDKAIKAAFLGLREAILDVASSSALHLGQLPDTPVPVDSLFHPRIWNRASVSQRRRRVMATVFHLLFRRILRPGLRIFALQAFLKSDEHSISASEAHLRALEKELEARGVDSTTRHAWIAATIDVTAPLRDVPEHVEGITQQIFEALQPIIRFAFSRNADKVKARISAICEEAVRLKLAMRATSGGYKVEVPSRDAKKWGGPWCDQGQRTSGDVACIPFGALTKLKEGKDEEKKKFILEKAWVISRGGGGKLKRKASTPTVEEKRPEKRVSSNQLVSAAQLARIKALMSEE
ncbi:hypothetical protein C8A03DRAFT_48153 [Achaetomium macrosporum]|uniref:Uncharacterized protein n=1 Tax=Achaetomium macrosporum TaxID=79813 RepID=A0AAN7H6P6_9PEZI|nr:hypothetical protein C8A03DRAFT_48153 [Achaetomium macrosporum]